MAWDKPYAIVRVGQDGVASVVHAADKMKDARYWLQYIALPGDAMIQTPAHPKHTAGPEPLYQGHLVKRGKIAHDEGGWKTQVLGGGVSLRWPE